jgi:hypothetical protein
MAKGLAIWGKLELVTVDCRLVCLETATFSLKILDFEMSTSRADQDGSHSVALKKLVRKIRHQGSLATANNH